MERPWIEGVIMMRPEGPVLRDPQSLFALSAPPPPTLTLREIVEEAVEWQREAESVIGLCVVAGGKTQVLARRGAQVATVYGVLRQSLDALPASSERAEADELLNFHRQLVQQALLLGFRPDSPERERVAAHFSGGLGAQGARLRRLRWRMAGPAA